MRLDKINKEGRLNRENKSMDWTLEHTKVKQIENEKEPAEEAKDQQEDHQDSLVQASEVKWRKQFKEEEMITNVNYSLGSMTVEGRERTIWQNRGHWMLYQQFQWWR